MNDQLEIRLQRNDGALVRLLGLAERRGFPPKWVSAISLNPQLMQVRLRVEALRPLDQLVVQMRKLHDVQAVEWT